MVPADALGLRRYALSSWRGLLDLSTAQRKENAVAQKESNESSSSSFMPSLVKARCSSLSIDASRYRFCAAGVVRKRVAAFLTFVEGIVSMQTEMHSHRDRTSLAESRGGRGETSTCWALLEVAYRTDSNDVAACEHGADLNPSDGVESQVARREEAMMDFMML